MIEHDPDYDPAEFAEFDEYPTYDPTAATPITIVFRDIDTGHEPPF